MSVKLELVVLYCYMKKYINNALGLLLLAEGLLLLYRFIFLMKIRDIFDMGSLLPMFVLVIYVATMILFIFAGIGVWKSKNWAIICGWTALLLPEILKLIVPSARSPLNDNYYILIVNLLILIYLSLQWKKKVN